MQDTSRKHETTLPYVITLFKTLGIIMNAFTAIFNENAFDPQWSNMIESIINYKKEVHEKELTGKILNTKNKSNIRKLLLKEYKFHTINGTQFIRLTHLTGVLNRSKVLKRDISREGFIEVNTLVDWIHEENEKVKKTWLKKYGC